MKDLKLKAVLQNHQKTKFFVSEEYGIDNGLWKILKNESTIGIEEITTSKKFLDEVPENEHLDGWCIVDFIRPLGINDKNGVKIYEGDIVSVSKNFPEQYEVIYQDISFKFKATKNNHFVREGSVWNLDLDFEFEVVGKAYV